LKHYASALIGCGIDLGRIFDEGLRRAFLPIRTINPELYFRLSYCFCTEYPQDIREAEIFCDSNHIFIEAAVFYANIPSSQGCWF
jgi:hypothetical protein